MLGRALKGLNREGLSDKARAALLTSVRQAETAGNNAGRAYARAMEGGVVPALQRMAARAMVALGALFALNQIKRFMQDSVTAFLASNRATDEMQAATLRASSAWTDMQASIGGVIFALLGGEEGVNRIAGQIESLTRWIDENAATWESWGRAISRIVGGFAAEVVREFRKARAEMEALLAWAARRLPSAPGVGTAARSRWDAAMSTDGRDLRAGGSSGAGGTWEPAGTGGRPGTGVRAKIAQSTLDEIRAMTDLNALLERQTDIRRRLNNERAKGAPNLTVVRALTAEQAEVTSRITEIRRGEAAGRRAEAAARKAEAARQRAERERQRHADAIERTSDEMERALAALTRDTAQTALVQLARLEREAVETFRKAGRKFPEAMAEGFRERRAALEGLVRLEDFMQRGEDLTRAVGQGGGTYAERGALHAMIEAMEAEAAQLPENSRLREQYTDAIARFRQVYERAVDAVVEGAEREADAEKKALDAVIRARQERLRARMEMARELEEAARGVADLVDQIGLFDRRLTDAIRNVAQMGRALSDVASIWSAAGSLAGFISGGGIGAAIGAVSAGVSLYQGLTQESPQDRERREILKRNTEALNSLRLSMEGFRATNESLERVQRAAAGLSSGYTRGRAVNNAPQDRAELARYLRQFGLTLAQFERIAKELGVELYDSAGRIIPKALNDLAAAAGVAIEALTGFAKTVDDRRREQELRANIFDEATDAAARLKREFAILAEFAPHLIEQFGLAGLDLDTPEGREAMEAALRAIFTAFQAGTLNLGSMTREEFIAWMEAMEAYLDELGSGPAGATQGWQVTRSIAEVTANRLIGYAATQTYWLEVIARAITGGNVTVPPPLGLPGPEQVGAAPAGTVSAGHTYHFGANSVVITVPASADPYETGRAVGRGFRDGVDSPRETDQALAVRALDKQRRLGLAMGR